MFFLTAALKFKLAIRLLLNIRKFITGACMGIL